jgi:hypothetical protein
MCEVNPLGECLDETSDHLLSIIRLSLVKLSDNMFA